MNATLFFALCLCALPCVIPAQDAPWSWGRSINGPSNEDEIDAVASDAFKNVYISGKFEDSILVAGSATPLISAGLADIMLVKYDSTGNLLWAKQFGGTGEDNAFDAVCDLDNNLLVSGYFQESIAFDTVSFTSFGGFDFFLVKFDPLGHVLWAKQYGGTGNDGGNEVCTDNLNRILVSADADGPFNTDSFSFNATGNRDSYLISLQADGSENWARAIQGAGAAQGKAVAVDLSGNVYFGGSYVGPSAALDQWNTPHDFPLATTRDAFLTAWTAEGNFKWLKTWGGSGNDLCKGIATNSAGNIFVMGPFENDVLLDEQSLVIGDQVNFYLWKMDSTGYSMWVRHIASAEDILEGGEVLADGHNGVFFGLGMTDVLSLPSTNALLQLTLPSEGAYPVLINYTDEGDVLFTKVADQSYYSTFGEISRSGNAVFLDSPYLGTSVFGGDTLTTSSLTNKDAGLVCIQTPLDLFNPVVELYKPISDGLLFTSYPNPADSELRLVLPEGAYRVLLFNSSGQQVLQFEYTNRLSPVNIAPLSAGAYAVVAIGQQAIYTSKFIKQ